MLHATSHKKLSIQGDKTSRAVTRTQRCRRRSALSSLTAGTLLCLNTCTSIVDPALDARAQRINPPTVYRRWWAMVEACSNLSGSFDDVSWYVVPNSDVVDKGNDIVGAYWAPVSNSIVIAGNGEYSGSVVRHEMLHALIRSPSGHSRSYFVDRCGGVVSCGSPCMTDIGTAPAPPADAIPMGIQALSVAAVLIPGQPAVTIDDGVFTVAVTATNPNSYPIVVTLDPTWANRSFFFLLYGGQPGIGETDRIWDASLTYFRAGETKRRYFDLTLTGLPGSPSLLPGHYDLQFGFNGVVMTGVSVTLLP